MACSLKFQNSSAVNHFGREFNNADRLGSGVMLQPSSDSALQSVACTAEGLNRRS